MKNSLFLGTRFKKSKFWNDFKLEVEHYLTEKWNFHIDFRCDALELENGNFADLVGEAEAQKARQDELNAEKEELEIRQVELQSEHDKESEANRKILKKYKKMMKKKKKLKLEGKRILLLKLTFFFHY